MKNICISAAVVLAIASSICAQQVSRDEKFKTIEELRTRIAVLEEEFLSPEPSDIDTAQKQGGTALRLLPREKFDGKIITSGGGAYYSFVRNTHKYGYGSDIGLEQGKLKVGFAGADYGLLLDLGDMALADVSLESPQVAFLASYKPPTKMAEIRSEQKRSYKYEAPEAMYSDYVDARVGHTYIDRSIDFDTSDVLVVFRILRKDADGSLVLAWKKLKTFDKPTIDRETPVVANK